MASARSYAQFPRRRGLGRACGDIEAIDSARVTTRILYVTAHPDDESGAVDVSGARAAADVALLSLTRRRRRTNALGPSRLRSWIDSHAGVAGGYARYGVKLISRVRRILDSPRRRRDGKGWGDQVLEDMGSRDSLRSREYCD